MRTRTTVALAVVTAGVFLGSEKAGAGDDPPAAVSKASSDDRVKEVGGRLMAGSETIDVVAALDEPPRDSSIATKDDTPLLETPRSISITDRHTLDALQAINLTQVHDFAVAIIPEDERGPGFARGFRLGFYDLRRDGLRTYTWSVREPVGLDRVQYLRGPTALLYGDGSPGGLVNLVLKKPLPVPRYEVGLSVGGLGYRRATADATGPLGRRVRYRVVAAAEGLENGFDNDERRLSVLPMLSFDLGEATTLHLDGEYYDQRGRGYRHAVPATREAQQGDFSGLPWDLNMASPDDRWLGWNASFGLRLDSRFSDRVSLHAAGRYTKIDGDLGFQALAGLASDGRTAFRFLYREDSVWDEYQGDVFALISAKTGGVQHRLVVGFEGGLSTTDSAIGTASAPSLDIFDPVYGPRPPDPPLSPSRFDLTRLGLYVQDQIRLTRTVTVVPGLRWSHVGLEDHVVSSGRPARQDEHAVSPALGAVVLARSWMSVYASYAEGFDPPAPAQFDEGGAPLASIDSRSFEAGFKTETFGRRLAATAAAFWTTQTNVPEADTRGFYRQIAEGRSHGIELEVVGRPARGFDVRAGYAWTVAEISQDASGFAGRALPNAPRHKAELWLREQIHRGRLRSLALAAGVVHVSERFTTPDNLVRLAPYTRFDASVSYELAGPRLVLAVGGQNLTNARYVTSGTGRNLFAGAPRRLSAWLTSRF